MQTTTTEFTNYPISTVLDQLKQSLAAGHTVLRSPTGSGKTTIAPIALLQQKWLAGKKIYMLEPRRMAARAAAHRMSMLLGEGVGGCVGYITRYDKKVSAKTRIFVVTEGIFLRTIQQDQELKDVGLVIFDEYHERSLTADLCLALALDLATLREDLRLLVMSATLDSEKLAKILGGAQVVESAGRSYPVSVIYRPPVNEFSSLAPTAISAISYALKNHPGDVLTFLPGIADIRAVEGGLAETSCEAEVLPLYGDLAVEQQDKILAPKKDSGRRIILATPVAETSLTVDGVRIIVDSGLHKHPQYDPQTGLTSLVTSRISRASAEQRRGRAGRQNSGVCIRLWDEKVDHGLLAFTPPEICNADLTNLVLELAHWGVYDPLQLSWLDPPNSGAWQEAVKLLRQFKALDRQITASGKELLKFPLHPRLSYMLIQSKRLSLGLTGCFLAAILSERDIFQTKDAGSDICERLRVLSTKKFSSETGIHKQTCKQILHNVERWRLMLGISSSEKIDHQAVGNILCFAYPDRIAIKRSQNDGTFQLATGRQAKLDICDTLSRSPLIVAPKIDSRSGGGKIFMAASISLTEIEENHHQLIETGDKVAWDKKESAVQARREVTIGSARLSSKPIPLRDKDAALAILLKAISEIGGEALPWSTPSRELQARLQTLFLHDCKNWQDFSDQSLVADLSWLEPFCYGFSKLQDLKSIDFQAALLSKLPYDKQQKLNRLAPTHICVPSGSKVRISYQLDKAPILAVRLQELFGLEKTPTICAGSLPLTLHLLSPARRPMQITKDLQSFWQRTYPEIKKELAGRYPKHYWPENPLQAQATAKTKARM